MIKTKEPVIYFIDARTLKEASGIIEETVISYTRKPTLGNYEIEVFYKVDGIDWKREIYYKTYQEVDMLKQYVLNNYQFGNIEGSVLEDKILQIGLLLSALNDKHFGIIDPNKWELT